MNKLFLLTVFFLSTILLNAQKIYDNPNHLWKPAEDNVFLQEESQKVFTDSPIQSVEEYQGKCYAVMNNKIYLLEDDTFNLAKGSPSNVKKLFNEVGELWAISKGGLYKLDQGNWKLIDDKEFVDLTTHNGLLHAATKEEIFKLEDGKIVTTKPEDGYFTSNTTMMMEDGSQVLADPVRLGPIDKIASYSGTLYVLRPGRLVLFDGKMVNEDFIDWGNLPSRQTNDMLSYGSRLFISTDRGLAVLRGAAFTILKGEDGLPYEKTTCLEPGFENDL